MKYDGELADTIRKRNESGWYQRAQAIADNVDNWETWFSEDASPDFSTDPVNKPDHYRLGGGIECIQYIEQVLSPEQFIGFLRGNAIKYQHRCMYKGKPVEDLEKAEVYTKWLVQAMKGQKIDV